MSQADELMKGFKVGYQNAPFSALGSAIKSTIGRLTQQEDLASGLMAKGGIESMFREPGAYKPKTRDEALDFERAKAGIISPDDALEREKTELEIKQLKQNIETTEQKNQKEVDFIRSQATDNLATVRKIKEGAKYFGFFGDLPSQVTNPEAMFGADKSYGSRKEWENNINRLLSGKVIDIITTMKSASQTGATGFGQLNAQEGEWLRQASTALTKDLTPEKALYYLDRMEKIYEKILSGSESSNTGNPFNQRNNASGDVTDEEDDFTKAARM